MNVVPAANSRTKMNNQTSQCRRIAQDVSKLKTDKLTPEDASELFAIAEAIQKKVKDSICQTTLDDVGAARHTVPMECKRLQGLVWAQIGEVVVEEERNWLVLETNRKPALQLSQDLVLRQFNQCLRNRVPLKTSVSESVQIDPPYDSCVLATLGQALGFCSAGTLKVTSISLEVVDCLEEVRALARQH